VNATAPMRQARDQYHVCRVIAKFLIKAFVSYQQLWMLIAIRHVSLFLLFYPHSSVIQMRSHCRKTSTGNPVSACDVGFFVPQPMLEWCHRLSVFRLLSYKLFVGISPDL